MNRIDTLVEIADFLQNQQLRNELMELKAKSEDESTPLHIPFVGEFSAGKTSLLNALTDAKSLEVATLPTTATIYEIHFGAERNYAVVVGNEGELTEVADIASLRNEELGDTPLVRIYDTSTRVPNDLVILDTPGISSPDVRHREVLVKTLPYVDALFLVVDCNQQITKSLTRFIEEATLAGRKTYLVLTKCDMKHPSDLDGIKQYIAHNNKLPLEQMACVSAQRGDLAEFYALIERIKRDKRAVMASSLKARLQYIEMDLKQSLEALIKLPNNVEGLEASLDTLKRAERESRNEVDNLISEVRQIANNNGYDSVKRFEQLLGDRLNVLLAKYSDSLTYDANSAVESTARHVFESYRQSLDVALQGTSRNYGEHLRTAVQRLNLSELEASVSGFAFNLEGIGHSWDKNIASGIQAVGIAAIAAGTFVATQGMSGVATAAGAATKTAGTVSTVASIADTVTDVASMSKMAKLQRTIAKSSTYVQRGIDLTNQVVATQQQVASSPAKGVIEGLVGRVSELSAKPKRQRAVREAMEMEIVPNFKYQMEHNTQRIISMMQTLVTEETAMVYEERRTQIESLRQDLAQQREAYEQRVLRLKKYVSILS